MGEIVTTDGMFAQMKRDNANAEVKRQEFLALSKEEQIALFEKNMREAEKKTNQYPVFVTGIEGAKKYEKVMKEATEGFEIQEKPIVGKIDTPKEVKTTMTKEQYEKAQQDPSEKAEYKTESGMKYYPIKLTAQDGSGETVTIRLLENLTARRLKEEDETFQEYTIRRAYIKKADKQIKEGEMVWDPSWGSVNQANALRVSTELNAKKQPTPMVKLPKGLPFKERMRLKMIADKKKK